LSLFDHEKAYVFVIIWKFKESLKELFKINLITPEIGTHF